MKLTFYMFDDNVESFDDLIDAEKMTPENGYSELLPINYEYDFEFKAFIQKNRSKPPKWLQYLENDFADLDDILNTYNSFIALIKVAVDGEDYFFAVIFGYSRSALNSDFFRPDFSIKTALNSINPDEIKLFDVKNLDLVTIQKRVVMNTLSSINQFDVDFFQDLVKRIEGKPLEESFGSKVSGSYSSFSINCDVDFRNLGEKCKTFVNIYRSDNYREHFGFIDDIKIVKKKGIIKDLREKLLESINNRDFSLLRLAYPDMIDYNRCSSFEIKYRWECIECEEVSIDEFNSLLNTLEDPISDFDELKKIKAIGFDDNGNPITKKSSISNFIVFETSLDDNKYILSEGNWFRIDDAYYEKVNKEVEAIPLYDRNNLPDWNENEKEGDYNARVTERNSEHFILLDKRNFQSREMGTSKVEIADLLSKDKELFFIKKSNRSSTLSHLFSQGSVSALMLYDYKNYREKVFEYLNNKWQLNLTDTNFKASDYTAIYAIASAREGDIRENLPFFSKVNLLIHYKTIHRIGIPVKVLKINIVSPN